MTSTRSAHKLFLALLALAFFFSTTACDQISIKSDRESAMEKVLEERNIDLSKKIDSNSVINVAEIEELKKISIAIIEKHSKDDLEGMFDILADHSPLPAAEIKTAREQTIKQLNSVKPRFGDYVGFEFIHSENIGESIIRHDCIVKCENHIIRWEFYYYKPGDKWFLSSFLWDDQMRRIQNGNNS